jgi:hypothetical protein
MLTACTLLTAACATSGESGAFCPKPPPVPEVLKQPVSTDPRLIEEWQKLMESYRTVLRESLKEAIRQ